MDATPVRRAGLQHQELRDADGVPAKPSASDIRTNASLLVELAERRLGGRDFGLDLHDEQGRCLCVPRKDVDRSSRAGRLVGDLDANLPVCSSETGRDLVQEGRVARIKEPLDFAAAPANVDHEASIDRSRHASEHLAGHSITVPAFDEGDERLGNMGDARDVDLPQALAASERSYDEAKSRPIHGSSFAGRAYPALIELLSRRPWRPWVPGVLGPGRPGSRAPLAPRRPWLPGVPVRGFRVSQQWRCCYPLKPARCPALRH